MFIFSLNCSFNEHSRSHPGENPLSDTPTYNLYQKDKENLELTVAVPGYKQHELDISVLNNKLTIT